MCHVDTTNLRVCFTVRVLQCVWDFLLVMPVMSFQTATVESIAQQNDDGHLHEQHWSLRSMMLFFGVHVSNRAMHVIV